jgi:low temperature requirement protein LtrA
MAAMAAAAEPRQPRLSATLREGERVTPLELFFDLVFVLAITQCTALMSHHPTWSGIAQGLLVLGMLWWSWTGYSWLTSVIDPEEGAVRLVMFGAMAALLLVSLCVPEAFGDLALAFALIYGAVRTAHIGLFMLASPDDDGLRHSVLALAASTAIAVTLLALASLFDGLAQGALWALALLLDMGGPYFFGSEGWKLVPGHFAERHGLIVIIALGESIVAIGVGAAHELTLGIGAAAVLGVALTAAMWWVYFDIVAIVAARRLSESEVGKVQNEMARDSYSYLHLLMVAGIVLVALGLKKTIGHFDGHLDTVPAFALLGGLALYLLGHVAFRFRHIHTINRRRLLLALVLLILVPVATEVPALVALGAVNVLIWAMIAYETRSYGEGRHQVRRPMATAET